MCGLVGIISLNSIDLNCLEKMSASIEHRGPDGYGVYEGDGFAFAHRRLSILDISDAGHQPMTYLQRYVITYNGEIFNHVELREQLIANGYEFTSHTDTEVIMAAYDFWGADCLNKFNGMWAFIIYDNLKNSFFISRDRFGIKPLYYYQNNETIIFGSEIKSLLLHPEVETVPNEGYLKSYLLNGPKEHTKETAFSNIYRFNSASYLQATSSQLFSGFSEKSFWQLNSNLSIEPFNPEMAKVYAQKYYELLKDSVRLRLRADVKVGSALSGGLDSSSIVYLMNTILTEQGQEQLQETFSTVYKTDGTQHCDESQYIDEIAETLNVNSNQIEPQESDIFDQHYKLIYIMDTPPESTCMSGWHTFKSVKDSDIKVTLDGQGADEQMAGYLDYVRVYFASLPLIECYKEIRYFWNIPKIKKHLFIGILAAHIKSLFGQHNLSRLIKLCFKKNVDLNLNSKLRNHTLEQLQTLFHYSDRVSMGNSIESRMPFMDYRLVEFLASIPSSYKLRNGWTKYIARLAFNGKLPDSVCWRKDKMGWPIPEQHWFRGGLKDGFIDKIENSEIIKQLAPDFDINDKINGNENIVTLIRYFNISVWEEIYFKKDCS